MTAAAEQVQVELARIFAALWADRGSVLVQCPVPGVPVVDASAGELRENFEHGPRRGGNEEGKGREFGGREGCSIPDRSRWLNDEMSAVFPVVQNKGRELESPSFALHQLHAAVGESTRR